MQLIEKCTKVLTVVSMLVLGLERQLLHSINCILVQTENFDNQLHHFTKIIKNKTENFHNV